MYEPLELTKCKKCGKIIAEPRVDENVETMMNPYYLSASLLSTHFVAQGNILKSVIVKTGDFDKKA